MRRVTGVTFGAYLQRDLARPAGLDFLLQRPTRFGLGFQLAMPARRLGANPRAFGHFGAGGSLGFADRDAGVGFGYAMNQGRGGWQHEPVRRLIDLVYAAL